MGADNGGQQTVTAKIEHFDEIKGKQRLEALKSSSIEVECTYSKVTDVTDTEVLVPAIMLDEPLGDKEKYIGVTVTSAWQSVMGLGDSWLFLHIKFDGLGDITVRFNTDDIKIQEWVSRLIETGGIIILCDKSGEFDVGIMNVPTDIPIMQLAILATMSARKSMCVGG